MSRAPGNIRDSIVDYLSQTGSDAKVSEICEAISLRIGPIARSSVQSYLTLNTPGLFERPSRGHYRLRSQRRRKPNGLREEPASWETQTRVHHGDCFEWLLSQPPSSIHAVITDPPYGLVEYSEKEQTKLRSGRGGVWRIPPSFDGHKRSPLPRFTVLADHDRAALYAFFRRFGALVARVAVPGANVVVASNPLLFHLVASAMSDSGLELRGSIVRLVMTMRGGDRPKNAHNDFPDISVMPRSMWEPWVVLRRPLEGRVQDNLRKWKTGGFRRPSATQPFGDVIKSSPTPKRERAIAPHPSLKPQAFLRQIVRAALPLGEGIVLDPFAGAGSTIAAAEAIGYKAEGIELDAQYVSLAERAIPRLSALSI